MKDNVHRLLCSESETEDSIYREDIVRLVTKVIRCALGVSATHIDWTLVPYVRKSFYKHYIDGLKYIEGQPDDWLGQTWNDLKDNTPSITDAIYFNLESKAYQYAMDMTKKEIHQGTEGLFHNLK